LQKFSKSTTTFSQLFIRQKTFA